jgi:hypothetical protein
MLTRGVKIMNKKIFAIGILLLLIMALSGCTQQDKNVQNDVNESKFVGRWESQEEEGTIIYKIFDNKTIIGNATGERMDYQISGKWNVEDNQFIITSNKNDTFPYNYEFSNNNSTLSLTWEPTRRTVNFTKISDDPNNSGLI